MDCVLGAQNKTDIENMKNQIDDLKKDVTVDLSEVKEDIRSIRDDLIGRPTQEIANKIARVYALLGTAAGIIVSMTALIITLMNMKK